MFFMFHFAFFSLDSVELFLFRTLDLLRGGGALFNLRGGGGWNIFEINNVGQTLREINNLLFYITCNII